MKRVPIACSPPTSSRTGTIPLGGASYLTADHLGGTIVVTDSAGAEVQRYDYLPYGE